MAKLEGAVKPSAIQQEKLDFREYWLGAEKGRLVDPDKQRPSIAAAHKFAACFSHLSRAVGQLEPHQRIFLQELSSDTVHLVHVLAGGDARGARFYLRSVIENFWRHHYFRDHPVEYGWLHTRKKYFLEMKHLREHCGWLDCFEMKLNPLLGHLNDLYAQLSSAVHSTSSKTLVLRETLKDIRLSQEQSDSVVKDVRAVLRSTLALCLFSERGAYLLFSRGVQDLMLSTLTMREKAWLESDLQAANHED